MSTTQNTSTTGTTRYIRTAVATALTLCLSVKAFGHGSLEGSRILQVRAGESQGTTPAPWNGDYYNWNENSNNFTRYNQPDFSYANEVPTGTIHSGGKNNGTTGHDFSGLNTPSAGWQTTDVTAGSSFHLTYLATAPHEPSYFEVYLTLQGFDPTTQTLGWDNLEYLGRWTTDPGPSQVAFGRGSLPWLGSLDTYEWDITIPEDRAGIHTLVVVWQRDDPAGEAFFASRDFNVAPVPEPGTTALGLLAGASLLAWVKRRRLDDTKR